MFGSNLGIISSQRDAGGDLLFDQFPAPFGISTSKLRTDYSGFCMRVRRSTDNAEQDIGFSGDFIDTGALLSFCGGFDGFISIYYNQGSIEGTGVQIAAANQPQVVSSGVLTFNQDGRFAPLFSGNQWLNFGDNITINGNLNVFWKSSSIIAGDSYTWAKSKSGADPNRYAQFDDVIITVDSTNSASNMNFTLTNNRVDLFTYMGNSGNVILYENGISIATNTYSGSLNDSNFALLIGAYNDSSGSSASTFRHNGYIGTVAIYTTDETANRTNIETIISNLDS